MSSKGSWKLTGNKYFSCFLAVALFISLCAFASAKPKTAATGSGEVRSAVERAFQQLRAGEYDALYDVLPSTSQKRITRERFNSALLRTRDMYQLEKLELGAVSISGNMAVVETTIYGHVLRPFEGEGKIAAQQYLVREDGRWRIAATDRTTQKQLLAEHPDFARRFPVREPRIYFKRDGRWIDLGSLTALRNKLKN